MSGFDRLVGSYVHALELHGLYVAAITAEGIATIGVTADPDQHVRVMSRRAGADVQVTPLWCISNWHSQLLVEAARAELERIAPAAARRGWYGLTVDEAVDLVTVVAEMNGVQIATDEEVRANAEAAVAHVEQLVAEMKRTGGLKLANKSYRLMREKTEAAGGRAPNYAAWLFNYRQRLCALAAAASRAWNRQAFGELPPNVASTALAESC